MTLQILDEIKIYAGEGWEQITLRLWLVAYGASNEAGKADDYRAFLKQLAALCEDQGWLLECQTLEETP